MASLWLTGAVAFADEQRYLKAPPAISEILDAPATPVVVLSPGRDRLLIAQGLRYPPIAELSAPMLRLAGVRINPLSNGPHHPTNYTGFTVKALNDALEKKVPVPPNARFSLPIWSPDGKQFACLKYNPASVKNVVVNAAFGETFQWLPDSQTLVCQTIPAGRAKPPLPARVPPGPTVQESNGKAAPARTYQDLLENARDEELFDFYATAQLVFVNVRTAAITLVGKPGINSSFEPSPDGEHLLVTRVHRPYSYLVPASSFPRDVEVWDRTGKVEYKLAGLPLADEVPIGGVQPGPRSYHWRPTASATLVWVEALDGGSPTRKSPHRDHVLMLKAPFRSAPEELVKTEHRFSSLSWGEKGWVALLRETQNSRRWARTFLINPEQPGAEPKLLWDLSTQDRYHDPGAPLMRTTPSGQRAMRVHDNHIYLTGLGASPDGERPFLDRLDLATLKTERLFQCGERSYETVIALAADDASQFITRRETVLDPPNYFLRRTNGEKMALTHFPDPAPQLRGIRKQLMTYERADGVQLSFTLYLPPDYKAGTRLPTIVWAYPREFGDADTAGQVSGSPHRFTSIRGISHLFLVLQGYAVLDGATMPVIGDTKKMNDTYVEQIVASAKAAIDKAVEMGVTDPDRVGVGGHSYGAFMTANLLAHSDLFRAGIARSGAYNRTLTPFGFQSERRTLWEAPEMYLRVSPFMQANKIKEPLLLIHGEADNNPGTFPIQSERLFQAIKGNGGTARLVMLPYESHNYEARESVEHVLAEMINWADKYVKHAPPRSQPVPVAEH
jgi:dipeptidyl aminopeptidase/acylaminoacyl peptidase